MPDRLWPRPAKSLSVAASSPGSPLPHERAKPLAKGSTYPAKDLCSQCGLCDSRWVAYVKDSCAFLNQRFEAMETAAHGRSRDLENEDELYFGVQQRMLTARLQQPIAGAQWTGIASRIGVWPWRAVWWMPCSASAKARKIASLRFPAWPAPRRRCSVHG